MDQSGTEKPKILIVDDDRDAVQLLQLTLERRGYNVVPARSGPEAIDLIDEMTEQDTLWQPLPVDLILLDIMMPGADGFDICQRVKNDPVLRHIPIVMVTALGSASDKVTAVEFGADAYLTKPFLPEELDAAIRAKLRVKKREEVLLQQNRELAAVLAVCKAANRTLDPQRVASDSLAALTDRTDLVAAALYRYDGTAKLLKLAAQRGVARPEVLLVEGPDARIMNAHQPGPRVDLQEDSELSPDHSPPPALGSCLGIPLRSGDRRLGVLEVYRRQPDGFGEHDQEFFAEIGERIGNALENAEILQHTHAQLLKSSPPTADGT